MPLSFDQNPAAYAAGGAEGIGLAEAKVPECRAAESPAKPQGCASHHPGSGKAPRKVPPPRTGVG